jgi:ElaB/YqjD/DUF883 family membrane-anchored ribosome-binding protein
LNFHFATEEPMEQQPQIDRTLNKMRDIPLPARAEDLAHDARAKLNETVEQISGKAREYVRYADRRVQANPWTAVGVSFGVGAIFGALLALAINASQRGAISRLLR